MDKIKELLNRPVSSNPGMALVVALACGIGGLLFGYYVLGPLVLPLLP